MSTGRRGRRPYPVTTQQRNFHKTYKLICTAWELNRCLVRKGIKSLASPAALLLSLLIDFLANISNLVERKCSLETTCQV